MCCNIRNSLEANPSQTFWIQHIHIQYILDDVKRQAVKSFKCLCNHVFWNKWNAALCRNWHFVRFGNPQRVRVQHHCSTYKSQVCNKQTKLITPSQCDVLKICTLKLHECML